MQKDKGMDQEIEEITKSFEKSMEEFKNRKIYTHLTPEILSNIPDDLVEQAVVDYVVEKIYVDNMKSVEAFNDLPVGSQNLWITWLVEGEVNNGGFNQFYFNSSAKHAAAAPKAFRFFGADQHAILMDEVILARAKEAQVMQKYKDRNTLQAFSESYQETNLGPYDDRFYKLKEDLSTLRIGKIRSSPALFSSE